MDTILFFREVRSTDAQDVLAGVYDGISGHELHVQTVEREPTADVAESLANLWNPIGAILYYGIDLPKIDSGPFRKMATVLLCPDPKSVAPGMYVVTHDSAGTGRTAAKELLALGCREFAFVPAIGGKYWNDERGRAFADALSLHGFGCRSMDAVRGKEDDGAWQVRLRAFLRSLPARCGVFAANDKTAVNVIASARHEGISVPDSLAVIGVDDDAEICERASPSLSSIKPDFRKAGRLAAEMILAATGRAPRDSGKVRHRVTFGDVATVRRASTKLLARNDALVAEALEKIRREACSGLRPGAVAAVFPCTRRKADLRFRRAVGRTIGEEIRSVQLEEAKRQLAAGTRQIKTIGDFCGFSSPGAFRKFFRRETGMSLRDWRRINAKSGR